MTDFVEMMLILH